MPLVGLQYVIVVFPDQTHLLFDSNVILETIVIVPNMKQFFQNTRVVHFTSRKTDSENLAMILNIRCYLHTISNNFAKYQCPLSKKRSARYIL